MSAQGIIYPPFSSSMTSLAPISLTVIGGYISFYHAGTTASWADICSYRYERPLQAEKTPTTSGDMQGGWDGPGWGS